jgi:opacity protein-like surface antigen
MEYIDEVTRKSSCSLLSLIVMCGIGLLQTAPAQSRDAEQLFARRNTFGILGAYSNDSSHILLGDAGDRKLLQFGISYSRRLLMNRSVNWQYDGEFLPIVVESDPLSLVVENQTTPVPQTFSYSFGPALNCAPDTEAYSYIDPDTRTKYSGTISLTCQGRRWTFGQALSPAGMRLNLLPRRKIQPFLDAHGGYMYSTQPIPTDGAGSFNFTFDFGAGVEFYRSSTRSIRAEYRYHHISNRNTARENPGIDNGLLQVTYCFGR